MGGNSKMGEDSVAKKEKKKKKQQQQQLDTDRESSVEVKQINMEEEERNGKKKKKFLEEPLMSFPQVKDLKENEEAGGQKKKKRKRLDVDVESFCEVNDKIAPFVGYFPSGFDPQKVKNTDGDEGEEESLKIRAFRSKKFSNRLQFVVSPQEAMVDFVGTNYSGEAAAAQVCTYALGVLDKETQTLKIIPIAANKIFRLDPKLRNSSESSEDEEVDAPQSSYTDFRNLSKLYGTKKQRNWAHKVEDRRHKDDPETKSQLESKVGELQFSKETFEKVVGYGMHYIPPHDVNATAQEKAYPLDRIILDGEWNYLLDILELLQSTPDATLSSTFSENNGYPTFVTKRIQRLSQIQDEDEKRKLACIFSYISHLIRFKNLSSKLQKQWPEGKHSSYKFNGIPVVFFKKFVKMFVDPESFNLPSEKVDLIISYVLVLTLFADGFESETSDIARDLHMAPIELRPHYEKLGCKISIVKKLHQVTLPVPLKLPEIRLRRRMRR
ncbi:DNA-directed RNA polymerase I subunit rpa49 [Aristolochia californica]|uniref:DNA-directed RNA polymerase I subunit rpa49 n=1 Tax=Aristolochia californica TaxID=171875 RepID=UPI0035E2F199